MYNRWTELAFVHWDFDPDVVQRQLPYGVTVDTFEDRAWVGLIPFHMAVRAPATPWLPWIGSFLETNVRTYVVGPDGRRGVWFFSLDASRGAVSTVGRGLYGVPYRWSAMSLTVDGDEWVYRCHRRALGAPAPSSALRVRVGRACADDELSEFDHWSTARWRLFGLVRNRLRTAAVEHAPWPLRHAELRSCDDTLVAAAGLPLPNGEPRVRWSAGTEVRIGRPETY
jgi:hypothetical protein